MSTPVWIVGAGGHGQDVRAVLDACTAEGDGWEFVGFLDDDLSRDGVVGTVAKIEENGPERFLIGINDGAVRKQIAERAHPDRFSLAVSHPDALIGPNCYVRPGGVVGAGAVLSCNVVVGGHSHINVGATVSQGTWLSNYVTVCPGAHICGDCRIGEGASIFAGAVVANLRTVGAWARVGAGAAIVTGDVPAGATVR